MTSDGAGGGEDSPDNIDRDPLLGRVLLGRYEVLRRIGSGGMGAVYVGRQLAIGREVALKVLRGDLLNQESAKERFRREAEIIGSLRHPNTIQLIDYGETDDGFAVMVTELLVGIGLNERLYERGPLTLRETLELGIEVAGSLAEAHAAGLVHRDLKPGNIFLVDVVGKIHVKVLDFGIARIVDDEATRLTATGQIFGTPRYMSPEQGMATGDVDSRSDLYSLGLILYECLVGQPPFVAQTSMQYLGAHAMMTPPKLREKLPDAPADLEALIDLCLAKSPEARIQTADELADRLRMLSVSLQQGSPSDTLRSFAPAMATMASQTVAPTIQDALTRDPQAPLRAPPARRWLAVAVALAAVFAGFAVWSYFRADGTPVAVALDLGTIPTGRDAGHAVVRTERPEAGVLLALAVSSDAGTTEEAVVDSGTGIAAEVPRKKQKRRPRREKNATDAPQGNMGPMGGVSGPRAMWLPVDEQTSGPVEMAKTCEVSNVVAGPAKLILKDCRNGCAVIIDGVCAGKTPFDERAVPEGNKSVTVVCGETVVVDTVARLRASDPTTLSCR